ncbi:MAG: response regulator [Minicystis sp.]
MSDRSVPARPIVHARDPEEAEEALGRFYGDVSVEVRDPAAFEWRTRIVPLGPVFLAQGRCATGFALRGVLSGYAVSLSCGVRAQAAARDQAAEIRLGHGAAVVSPGYRFELRSEGEASLITLRVDPSFLAQELEALTGEATRGPLEFELRMATDSGAGATLERLCRFLLDELHGEAAPLDHPLVRAGIGDVVARTLLLGQPHDRAGLVQRPTPASGARVVRMVEERLDAGAAEPIRGADLAALTGESVRAIEAGFVAHRRSTPLAFLRSRRLELARRRLLQTGPDASVASVAHACGFLHLEPFEAAYAARFGETPEHTRGGARAGTEPPPPSPPAARARPVEHRPVLVVDDHPPSRQTVAQLLRREGYPVETFDSAGAFLAAARASGAGCALIELHLPDLDGLGIQAALADRAIPLPVVFLTGDGHAGAAVAAMKAGAVDFLVKPVDPAELLDAVARALARDAEARAARAEQEVLAAQIAALSPREREVCERVARGLLNKQIAAELDISESTVRTHRTRAMDQLGVDSAAALARLLARAGRDG